MGRIIINNTSSKPDHVAANMVAIIIEEGRISGDGKCYCYGTAFTNGLFVHAKANGKSDTFNVYDDPKATP